MQWAAPDSVMAALLTRKGYTATRYMANVVTFDALTKAINLAAIGAAKVAMQQKDQLVVTDSTIFLHDNAVVANTKDSSKVGLIAPGAGQQEIRDRKSVV